MPSNPQPAPHSPSHDPYLIIRIDKRAAWFFLAGLTVVAAFFFILLREQSRLDTASAKIPQAEPAAASLAALPDPAPLPSPGNSLQQASDSNSPVEPSSDNRGDPSPSPPTPEPVIIAAPPITKIYRVPVFQEPLLASQTTSDDNSSPEPSANPDPPSNPPTAPDASSHPYDWRSPTIITGAGGTFPNALYSKWFEDFRKVAPNLQFTYQAVGSGAGLQQLGKGIVEFSGTDQLFSDQILAHIDMPLLHVPTAIGAVVPAYNLSDMGELRFTPEILVGIYTGRILSWNDPLIAAANPGKSLPDLPITAIHRLDGCATTYMLTDYLSKVSLDWQQTIGVGTSVNWPVGLAAKGNEGVSTLLRQTPGSFAYVDFLFAAQNHIVFGSVRNRKGKFIKASLASLTAAGSSSDFSNDFFVSITNAPGADAYPISSFTWLLAPTRSHSVSEAADLRMFFHWMLQKQSQNIASKLGYAPLPEDLAARIDAQLSSLR